MVLGTLSQVLLRDKVRLITTSTYYPVNIIFRIQHSCARKYSAHLYLKTFTAF